MKRQTFLETLEHLKTSMLADAQAGLSGDRIAEKLGLNAKEAEAVHYELLKAGAISPDIKLDFAAVRKIKVTENGISIPLSHLRRLGMEQLFTVGKTVSFRTGEGVIIVEPVEVSESQDSAEPNATQPSINAIAGSEVRGGE